MGRHSTDENVIARSDTEITKLRAALMCARKQLMTLGGHADPTKHGYGDDIHRAVLDEIDNALAKN